MFMNLNQVVLWLRIHLVQNLHLVQNRSWIFQ